MVHLLQTNGKLDLCVFMCNSEGYFATRTLQLLVRSCVILCSYSINENDISSADLFLKQFFCMFMRIYGPYKCSFNMHLHLHLKQTLLDFGPTHTTWCYAYESMKGSMGS